MVTNEWEVNTRRSDRIGQGMTNASVNRSGRGPRRGQMEYKPRNTRVHQIAKEIHNYSIKQTGQGLRLCI